MARLYLARLTALAAALCVGGSASATSWVYDGGTYPNTPKLDWYDAGNIPANKKMTSDEFNARAQFEYDLRSAILSGYFHGLAQIASPPPAPAAGIIVFNLNGVLTLEDSLSRVWTFDTFWADAGAGTVAVNANAVVDGGVTAVAGYAISTPSQKVLYYQPTGNGDLTLTTGLTPDIPLLIGPNEIFDGDGYPAAIRFNNGDLTTSTTPIAAFQNNGITTFSIGSGGNLTFGLVSNTLSPLLTSFAAPGLPGFRFNTVRGVGDHSIPFAVEAGGVDQFRIGDAGVAWAAGGFDANSQKLVNLAPPTAATDGVNWNSTNTTISAYAPLDLTTTSVVLAQATSRHPGTQLVVDIQRLKNDASNGNGSTTLTLKDVNTATTLATWIIDCTCAASSGPCSPDAGFNGVIHFDAGVAISNLDIITATMTTTCASGNGSFNFNANW